MKKNPEKLSIVGKVFLALQSNSEKLNDHRLLQREVPYCKGAFWKPRKVLLEKQTNEENFLKKQRELFWHDSMNVKNMS